MSRGKLIENIFSYIQNKLYFSNFFFIGDGINKVLIHSKKKGQEFITERKIVSFLKESKYYYK